MASTTPSATFNIGIPTDSLIRSVSFCMLVPEAGTYSTIKVGKPINLVGPDGASDTIQAVVRNKRIGPLYDHLSGYGMTSYDVVNRTYDVSIIVENLRSLYPATEDVDVVDAVYTLLIFDPLPMKPSEIPAPMPTL